MKNRDSHNINTRNKYKLAVRDGRYQKIEKLFMGQYISSYNKILCPKYAIIEDQSKTVLPVIYYSVSLHLDHKNP